jgi:hypothetical protein
MWSDHDAQLLTIKSIVAATNVVIFKHSSRKIMKVMQSQLLLRNETLVSVIGSGTKDKFNSFLHTFINVSEACFPIKYKVMCKIKKV